MFQQYRSMLPYRSLLALMVLIGCAPEITTPKYTTEPNWTAENPLASRGASDRVIPNRIASCHFF